MREKNTFPITLWGLEDVLVYVRIKMEIPNIMNSAELNNQQRRDWGIHRPLRLNWMATSSISWGNVMTIEQRMTYTRGNLGSLLYLRFFLEKCDYSVDVRMQNEWCSFAWKYFVEKWILQYLPFTPSAKLWLNLELFWAKGLCRDWINLMGSWFPSLHWNANRCIGVRI